MADDGEVVGSEAGTDGGLVFVELDVQAPVKAVLYLPVTANGARDARGVRTFSQSDVAQLYFVDALRKSGLSIEGIQYYVKLQRRGAATRDERLAIVRAQETVLEYQRAELDESLKRLSAAGVELSTDRKSR